MNSDKNQSRLLQLCRRVCSFSDFRSVRLEEVTLAKEKEKKVLSRGFAIELYELFHFRDHSSMILKRVNFLLIFSIEYRKLKYRKL